MSPVQFVTYLSERTLNLINNYKILRDYSPRFFPYFFPKFRVWNVLDFARRLEGVLERSKQIEAAVRRAINLKTEALATAANGVAMASSRNGTLMGSAHVLTVERLCLTEFREICAAAAVLLAEIDGEQAPAHTNLLSALLRDARSAALETFIKFAAPGHTHSSIKGFADTRLRSLELLMVEASDGAVSDLRLGIAGGINVKKQTSGVSIDNRGGSGQFAINSPGSTQAIGGNQITAADLETIAQLLKQVRDAAASAEIPEDRRETLNDAVVNAERELQALPPNAGRIKRLLTTVGTVARDLGVSVGASLITTKLQQMGINL